MDNLLRSFLTELSKNLDDLEKALETFTHNPETKKALDEIIRLINLMQSRCKFLGLKRLETLVLSTKNVLDKASHAKFIIDPSKISLINEAIRVIKDIVAYVEIHGQEPKGNDNVLLLRLTQAIKQQIPLNTSITHQSQKYKDQSSLELAKQTKAFTQPLPNERVTVKKIMRKQVNKSRSKVLDGIRKFMKDLVNTKNNPQEFDGINHDITKLAGTKLIPSLIIGVSGIKFGIPQINIMEIMKLNSHVDYSFNKYIKKENTVQYNENLGNNVVEQSQYYCKLENINNNNVLNLRGNLLPAIYLTEVLEDEFKANYNNSFNLDNKSEVNKYVLLCEASDINFGLIVDSIFDTNDIIIDSRPSLKMQFLSKIGSDICLGSATLSDGDEVILLEPSNIYKSFIATKPIYQTTPKLSPVYKSVKEQKNANEQGFLIMRQFNGKKIAIALEKVVKLEKINIQNISYSQAKRVIKYQNSFIPVVCLDEGVQLPETGNITLVIVTSNNQILSFPVQKIIDLIDVEIIKSNKCNDNLVIDGEYINILDTDRLFHENIKEFEKKELTTGYKNRVLLIDDSSFFRKFIPPSLEKLGYQVTAVDTAGKALKLLKTETYNAIIADFNMLEMPSVELVKFCATDDRVASVPIIAIAVNINDKALEQYKKLGFSACISKIKHNELTNTLAKLTSK